MVTDVITVLMSPRWSAACKLCRRRVTWRKKLDGDLVKFDADPTPLATYTQPGGVRLLQDLAADEIHAIRCAGIDHSLFDEVAELR